MSSQEHLLIVGASTRAAAFSALRAGLHPWCADLFADADLQVRCPTVRLSRKGYPQNLLHFRDLDLPGPWMYTGALENWPWLVDRIASRRPLWGNIGASLRRARDPAYVARVFRRAGLAHPRVRLHGIPLAGRWLRKPLHMAGGSGIREIPAELPLGVQPSRARRFWNRLTEASWNVFGALELDQVPKTYCQEYIAGESSAAVYLADGQKAQFLGATRQLIGQPWLHAKPYQYCGSLGPLPFDAGLETTLKRIGNTLARPCGLRGLFGVDFILCEGNACPVEVNPRYTASVEVLEYATGISALALHRRVFDRAAPAAHTASRPAPSWTGKAILFARENIDFPQTGPWRSVVESPGSIDELPAFADIPHAGESFKAGAPIITFFARADSEPACLEKLQTIAADLDRHLFGQ